MDSRHERTRDAAEDLVRRGVGAAPITIKTYDRLINGALEDAAVRLQLRLAEDARDAGNLDTWARHLWTAVDVVRPVPMTEEGCR